MPRRASSHLNSGYPAALMTHVMPTTLQETDWEMFLVRTGIVETLTVDFIIFFII
jgi:hypothetical protein